MHVGIEEGGPAQHVGAGERCAIAAEARLGRDAGKVVEDGDVLGQDAAVIQPERRHRACRVDREKFLSLELIARHCHGFIRQADPFEHDVIGERAGAGKVKQFHVVQP